MMHRLLLAGVAALIAGSALAADPQDHAGAYWLSGLSEGDETCDVTLGTEGVVGGWSIELADDCAADFDLPDGIAAWTMGGDGSVRFIDPLRKTLLTFEPTEIGGYVAQRRGQEPISLDRAMDGPEPTEHDRMSGDWVLNRMGGATVCRLVMTSDADGASGELAAEPGCAPAYAGIVRFKVAGERVQLLDRAGKSVLRLSGDSIQGFDGDDANREYIGFMRDWGE